MGLSLAFCFTLDCPAASLRSWRISLIVLYSGGYSIHRTVHWSKWDGLIHLVHIIVLDTTYPRTATTSPIASWTSRHIHTLQAGADGSRSSHFSFIVHILFRLLHE